MCRKRIVQLLTSLAVLSCMLLPVQAAPQINIVPQIQLLLLSPKTIVGMWGFDESGNRVNKDVFFTNEEKVCFRTILKDLPTPSLILRVEWFRDGSSYRTVFDDFEIDGTTPSTVIDLDDICVINTEIGLAPPPPPPPINWNIVVSINGAIVEDHGFELREP